MKPYGHNFLRQNLDWSPPLGWKGSPFSFLSFFGFLSFLFPKMAYHSVSLQWRICLRWCARRWGSQRQEFTCVNDWAGMPKSTQQFAIITHQKRANPGLRQAQKQWTATIKRLCPASISVPSLSLERTVFLVNLHIIAPFLSTYRILYCSNS